MKISYAITVCDEKKEIKRLVDFLLHHKRQNDEVVVLFDQKNGDEEIATMLTKLNKLPNFQMWRGFFDGHFADWKNKLTEYCSGDYIFQIDADEEVTEKFITELPTVLEVNDDVEVFRIPRVNKVNGLTKEHIQKWGWQVGPQGRVNWPDYQWRIWKNKKNIKWQNKVHEVLVGHNNYTDLPAIEEWALIHIKDIKKQEKQNNYYSTLT
tara:strand:- start:138 stop:764 length:627 start_codon:yes stop_codon:yes gene_type:complete